MPNAHCRPYTVPKYTLKYLYLSFFMLFKNTYAQFILHKLLLSAATKSYSFRRTVKKKKLQIILPFIMNMST